MSHYIGTGGVLWAPDYLCKERGAAVGESWLIANLTAVAEYMETVFNKTPLAADVPMMFGDLPIAMQLLELTGESRFDAKTPKWFSRPFTNVQHSRKLRHPGLQRQLGLLDARMPIGVSIVTECRTTGRVPQQCL